MDVASVLTEELNPVRAVGRRLGVIGVNPGDMSVNVMSI